MAVGAATTISSTILFISEGLCDCENTVFSFGIGLNVGLLFEILNRVEFSPFSKVEMLHSSFFLNLNSIAKIRIKFELSLCTRPKVA